MPSRSEFQTGKSNNFTLGVDYNLAAESRLRRLGLLDLGRVPDALEHELAVAGDEHAVDVGGVQRVDRRHREVAALDARTVTAVTAADFAAGLVAVNFPRGFIGMDGVGLRTHFRAPLHAVENEEFRFRAEVAGVGDAGGLQVLLGLHGDRARIALVHLHGGRLDDVAGDDDGGVLERQRHRAREAGAVVGLRQVHQHDLVRPRAEATQERVRHTWFGNPLAPYKTVIV